MNNGWQIKKKRRMRRSVQTPHLCAALRAGRQVRNLNRIDYIRMRLTLRSTRTFALLLAIGFAFNLAQSGFGQRPATDYSKLSARPARDWVRDGVIYQIFP